MTNTKHKRWEVLFSKQFHQFHPWAVGVGRGAERWSLAKGWASLFRLRWIVTGCGAGRLWNLGSRCAVFWGPSWGADFVFCLILHVSLWSHYLRSVWAAVWRARKSFRKDFSSKSWSWTWSGSFFRYCRTSSRPANLIVLKRLYVRNYAKKPGRPQNRSNRQHENTTKNKNTAGSLQGADWGWNNYHLLVAHMSFFPIFLYRRCLGKSRTVRPSVSEAKVKRDTTAIYHLNCNKQIKHAGSGGTKQGRKRVPKGRMEEEGHQVIPWTRDWKDESPLGNTLGRRREGWMRVVRCLFHGSGVRKVSNWSNNGHIDKFESMDSYNKCKYHQNFKQNHCVKVKRVKRSTLRFHSVILGLVKRRSDTSANIANTKPSQA